MNFKTRELLLIILKTIYIAISNPFKKIKSKLKSVKNIVNKDGIVTERTLSDLYLENWQQGYKLTKPIDYILTEADGCWIAEIESLNIYGDADTEQRAIEDLKFEVVDLFDDLNRTGNNELSDEYIKIKEQINKMVYRKELKTA